MNLISRLSLGLVAALVPVMAYAIAPQNVMGINAVMNNGKVFVTWKQVANTDIKSYHVFYSHASILHNQGLYDDFESADGTTNSLTLQSTPPANELYVSVLAINNAGEESPYFVEEAKVVLNGTQPQSSASPTSATTIAGSTLQLLSVETVSSTGVTLHFSHMVSVDPAKAPQAFVIKTASGTVLAIRRLIIQGMTVKLDTDQQKSNVVYRIVVGDGVTGKNTDGTTVPLDPQQAPILFSGNMMDMMGGDSSVSSSMGLPTPVTPTSDLADVTQLRLTAQPDGEKTYTVSAVWQAPAFANAGASSSVTGYQISQSTDEGRTYGTPFPVNAQSTSVKIPHVPAGSFSLKVQAMYGDSGTSTGISQMIPLPGKQGSVQGTVINTPKPKTHLPNSGPALWLAIGGSGALSGAWGVNKAHKKLTKKKSKFGKIED